MAKSCCGGASSATKVKAKKSSCCGSGAENKSACCAPASSGIAASERADLCGSGCEDTAVLETQDRQTRARIEAKFVTGYIQTTVGDVPQVATRLDFSDTFGSWKCRWSINRMDYTVEPGIYCVGTPDDKSPVLVTANYKMTFDRVREQLSGLDLWIVVLDTDGVNVWCAAGKGTFGTEEVVRRVKDIGLDQLVSHRTLILPQLGATGVAAHEVKKLTGFRVVYGPIKARDIKAFLAADMVATEKMRTVTFTFTERIVLAPVELVGHMPGLIVVFGILFILNTIGLGHYGMVDFYAALGAIAVGTILVPALLPIIPGRAFSFKGGLLGLLWATGVNLLNGIPLPSYGVPSYGVPSYGVPSYGVPSYGVPSYGVPSYGILKAVAFMLLLPAVSAFCAMNFTGCSTYTSLSGVDREMKIALPTMLIAAIIGIILLLVNDFILVF